MGGSWDQGLCVLGGEGLPLAGGTRGAFLEEGAFGAVDRAATVTLGRV